MERRSADETDLLSKFTLMVRETMKRFYSICYMIGLAGDVVGILFALYTTSCSERFSGLFAIILTPFTMAFACAMLAYFKLPTEERPKPTRTWTVIHHPFSQFATLLAINVLLMLPEDQANSHVILYIAGGYIGVLLILYIWYFKSKH